MQLQLLFQMETLSCSKSPWLWIPGIYLFVWTFLSLLSQLSGNLRSDLLSHGQMHTSSIPQWGSASSSSLRHNLVHGNLSYLITSKASLWIYKKWEHCAQITWWKWNLRHLWKTHVWKQEINGICHLSNGNGPEPRDMMEEPLFS